METKDEIAAVYSVTNWNSCPLADTANTFNAGSPAGGSAADFL